MINCICIDDDNKPGIIELTDWVKKGDSYRMTIITVHPKQGFIQGCQLYEKPLDKYEPKYSAFKLSRFAIDINDLDALKELIKDSNDMKDVDVKKLIEESELQFI